MKVWKLVSGIISIILFGFVIFQSCAAGIGNALTNNGEVSGSAGFLVGVLMLVAGIISVAARKSEGSGGNIAIIILDDLAFLLGFAMAGSYSDLRVWAVWCMICAVMATISIFKS